MGDTWRASIVGGVRRRTRHTHVTRRDTGRDASFDRRRGTFTGAVASQADGRRCVSDGRGERTDDPPLPRRARDRPRHRNASRPHRPQRTPATEFLASPRQTESRCVSTRPGRCFESCVTPSDLPQQHQTKRARSPPRGDATSPGKGGGLQSFLQPLRSLRELDPTIGASPAASFIDETVTR
jgi:hypothetical protein